MYVMYRVCILSSNSSYELSTIYMHSMHVYYKLSYVAVRIIESSNKPANGPPAAVRTDDSGSTRSPPPYILE